MAAADGGAAVPGEQPVRESFPPPGSTQTAQRATRFGEPDHESPGVSEAEAIAQLSLIAASSSRGDGPSKALVGTAVALGVLLIALLVLALIVSIGPGATPAG